MDGELRILPWRLDSLRGLTVPAIHAGMTTFGHMKPEILKSRIRELFIIFIRLREGQSHLKSGTLTLSSLGI